VVLFLSHTLLFILSHDAWSLAAWYRNLEDKDKNDWTPLHCACNSGHLEVVAYLIQKGANVSALTIEDATCLHYFSKISPSGKEVLYTSTLQTILSKISNIDQQNKRAQTALSRVAADGLSRRRILLTELITRGANINLKDRYFRGTRYDRPV
jgi:ankyrin repeat protein